MRAKKILFITQEITPYVPETPMSLTGRYLPQAIQDNGHEIRTFLPKWGNINERRNQLHEVIRLSGMNIIIDDTDHPLIIKVASIQAAHMQVYFIDNDDYFQKREMAFDTNGDEYEDNAERAIFYARGVLETVKKLRWCPDVIHCQGWISAIAPIYIKTAYKDELPFHNTKVIFSPYETQLKRPLAENFRDCLQFRDTTAELINSLGLKFESSDDLIRLAIKYSDGIAEGDEHIDPSLLQYAADCEKPILKMQDKENYAEAYSNFYEQVMDKE